MKTISKSKLLSLLVILAIMTGSMSVTMLQVSANAQANKLVSVAESQIGYKTLSNGTTKYGTWYGIPKGAWCAMFVSWCANQAGISTSIVPKHADCDVGKNWFKSRGLWKNSKSQGGTYTPKKGDIIYFSSKYTMSDSTHVGIVTSVSGGRVYTIEGNTSKMCNKRNYSLGDRYIIGYGVPKYTTSTPPNTNGSYFPKYTGSTSSIVTALNAIGANSSYDYRKQIAAANGISNYTGTSAQNTNLLNLLKQGKLIKPNTGGTNVSYFKKYTGSSTSIVNALNAIGANSSYDYRKKIAAKNGISNYTGTSAQNTNLLNLLKRGKLIKP
mgnify:CR=1 FL=1